ncbi:MAG TPA: glycosyltransferase, partial [Conexibacter sp.]|nr:glycosyltransferase [Conexibacter sp.]
MRVALNLVFLVPGETGGMEVYARELLPRLAALDGVEPVAIVNRVAADDADAPWNAMRCLTAPVDARDRKQWVWGEQWHVPRLARHAGADLVHSLASTGPMRFAGGPPRVTTVHDLHYAVAPEAHFGLRGLGMRLLVPAAVKASRRVIAVSQATKGDVVRLIGVPAERVDVVHSAATPPDPAAPPTAEPELRARLGLGERPVLLSLAAKRPHKNVEGLIDAL